MNNITIIGNPYSKSVGKGSRYFVKGLCLCGSEREYVLSKIKNGIQKSCGCLKDKHKIKHGMYKDKFYITYQGIISRCNVVTHKLFKNYGGRGIKCLRNSFDEFKNDMYNDYVEHNNKFGGRSTSIDRIDVNGNYCKDNCRRATLKEQNNNKTNSHIINGKTIQQRSDEYGIPKTKLRHRIVKMGLPLDEALNYERVNKSGVEGVIRSNRDNRRIVQTIIEGKIKRKLFKELNEAIAYKNNAIIPTK